MCKRMKLKVFIPKLVCTREAIDISVLEPTRMNIYEHDSFWMVGVFLHHKVRRPLRFAKPSVPEGCLSPSSEWPSISCICSGRAVK